jgi:translocation and assembly module TamB
VLSKFFRRSLRAVGVLVLLVALVALALAAAVRTRPVRQYAGREVARVLKNELGLTARIREVDVDPTGLGIVARGIVLDHPLHGRLVEAEVLRISPSWWALLRGSVDLHGVTIERAGVWLKVREGKLVNLPELPESEAGTDSVELPFDWVRVRDSRLVVDADPWVNGELRHIDIRLDALDDGVLGLRLSTREGEVHHARGVEVIRAFEVEGSIGAAGGDVERARIETPKIQLKVNQASFGFPLGEHYRGKVALDLDVAHVAGWPHGLDLPRLEGALKVRADVRAGPKGPVGTATVDVHRGLIKRYTLGEDVRLKLTFAEDRIRWDGAVDLVGEEGGAVGLRGGVELREGLPLEVEADVRDVSFARLMEQLAVTPDARVSWTLAGTMSLKGTCAPLDLQGALRMPTRDFRVTRDAWHEAPVRPILAIPRAELVGGVAIRPDAFVLRDIDVALPNTRLRVDEVMLGFDDDLRVRGRALSWTLADSSPLLDFALGGRGSFEVEVGGTFSDPSVRGRIDIADFSFHSFLFGSIGTEFELDRSLQAVRFPSIEAVKRDSRYRIDDAFIDFRDDRLHTGGKVEIAKMTLDDFYHVFHWEDDERYEPYAGVTRGSLSLDYTMGHPGDTPRGTLVTEIELAIPEVSVHGVGLRDGEFSGRWTWRDHALGYRGGELEIRRFFAHKGDGTLNLSGRMRMGGALDVVAVGAHISLRDTEGVPEKAPGLRGSYAATANVKGTLANPRADIDLSLTGLSLDGEPIGDGRAYVRLSDKSDPWIRAALGWKPGAPPADERCGHAREGFARGEWPPDPPLRTADGLLPALDQPMAWLLCGEALGGQVRADLAIGRTGTYPARGLVELRDLAFGRLLPRAKGGAPMRGTVSGEVRFRDGALLATDTLVADVRLDILRAGQLDVELQNEGPIVVHFRRGGFDIESAEFRGPASNLHLRGGGSYAKGLTLDVAGNVDLGLVSSLSRASYDAIGRVELQFKLTGPLRKPAIFGHAKVHDAALGFASLPDPIQKVQGNVTFSAQRILFENFRGELGGGRFALSGAASLRDRGIGGYVFDLEAEGVGLEPREGIELRLGGRAQVGWKEGERVPLVKGTLRVEQLDYTRDIQMARTLEDFTKSQRADVAGYDPEADRVAFDLRIHQERPMRIHNNLIEAELQIEDAKQPFRLVGTDQRFGVTGLMTVRKGTVRFRGTEFELRQGDIAFDDETRIDPRFDLLATTDVRRQHDQANWRVEMHAWGTRDSFQFRLTSDPYLTEDDIALLLAVGMTHAEMAQLQTGELTSTAALEALATVTGVEREVHRALPEIDDLRVASAYSESSNRTEPQLFVGKRIADRVRLSASTGIAESRDFKTGVELQLNEQTSVEAMYNNQNASTASQIGDVGVDLKWRLEFD